MNQSRLARGRAVLFSRLRLRRWLILLVIPLAALPLFNTAAQIPAGHSEITPQFDRTPPTRSCPITLGVGESMDIGLRLNNHSADVNHALVRVAATPAPDPASPVVGLSGGTQANGTDSIMLQVTPDATHSYTITGNAKGSDSLLRLSKYVWDNQEGAGLTASDQISTAAFRVNVIDAFTYDPRPAPTVKVRTLTDSLPEGGTLEFRVDVHPPPTEDLNMLYTVQDDIAGTSTAFWYHIPARCASVDLTIPTVDDDVAEDDRTKRIDLIAMSGYAVDRQASVATAMSMENDQLTAVFDDTKLKIARTASASYGVKLSKQPQTDVTVMISAANSEADDGYFNIKTSGTGQPTTWAKSHSLSFTTTDWNRYQRVTIRGTAKSEPVEWMGNAGFQYGWYNVSLQHVVDADEIVKPRSLPMEFSSQGGPRVRLTVPADGATEATIYSPAVVALDTSKSSSVTLRMCVDRKGYDHGFTVQLRMYSAIKRVLGSGLVYRVSDAIGKEPVTFSPASYTVGNSGNNQCRNITVTAVDLTTEELDKIDCYSSYVKDGYVGRGVFGIMYPTHFHLTVSYPAADSVKAVCPEPFTGYLDNGIPKPTP